MLDVRELKAQDLQGLSDEAAQQIIERIQRLSRDIALREAQLEKLNFELARLKRWRFAAKTEAMSAEQRRLFEETLVEDEAGLQAQVAHGGADVPVAQPLRQAVQIDSGFEQVSRIAGCGCLHAG